MFIRFFRWQACAILILCALFAVNLPLRGDESTTKPDAKPDNSEEKLGVRYGEPVKHEYEIGMNLTGGTKRGSRFKVVLTVPMDWPEQTVKIIKTDKSPQIGKINYRTLNDGVRQMLISISSIKPHEKTSVMVKFEVERKPILPPADTTRFALPKKIDRKLRSFLMPSPLIESTHAKIRKTAKDLANEKLNAWQQVEAINTYVKANLSYKFAKKNVSAVAALEAGIGDCGEFSGLFIALCRASKIPARFIHVPGHAYAEFYLEDDKGHGHWFPCDPTSGYPLGSMPSTRMILQKGDRFKSPEERRTCRIAVPFILGRVAAGGSSPIFMTIMRDAKTGKAFRALPPE